MAGFVYGNGTAFGLGSDFGFLFQPTHNAVYGVQEVLLSDKLFAVAGGYQSCFVTYIGNVCPRESGSLACQKVYIHTIVYLDGAQVYTEYFLTLIKVG